jgi:hypothetical protein
MRKGLRTPLAAVAALVVAGLTAGIAWATIPDGTGSIHACYSASDKILRVLDSGACAKGEAPVSWNKDAVQGLQGPQGDQGLKGNTGLQGVAGVTFANGDGGLAINDQVIGGFFKELHCPTGAKALSGHWTWLGLDGSHLMDQSLAESWPIGDDAWGFATGAVHDWTGEGIEVGLSCVYTR